jgi:hypothetical protein
VDDGGAPSACAAEMAAAASTAGCNGGFVTPAANGTGGSCTPGNESTPQGSCTTASEICVGYSAGGEEGYCRATCEPPAGAVDESGCPTGFRCSRFMPADPFAICFLDCDSTHPCPDRFTCNPAFNRCEEDVEP